jgi:hypothetical protein
MLSNNNVDDRNGEKRKEGWGNYEGCGGAGRGVGNGP